MDPLLHDPRTKQQIKETLYAYLYNPVQKRFEQRIHAIASKNMLLQRLQHCSFVYRDVLHNSENSAPPRKANRLFPALHPEMDEYLRELKTLNDLEIPFVIGYINQVLNSTNHLCDYLRLFPEATHSPIKTLIATCPCTKEGLKQETVDALKARSCDAIKMMQQRMVTNLII